MNIQILKQLKESEDKVEFKEAKNQYSYKNGRKSVLGYVVAFANEKGGYLVFGMEDAHPHRVCGSQAFDGREGQLEQDVYRDTGIRIETEVLHEGDNRVLAIKIPSRPVGKLFYFEDVPLMRVGDSLVKMSEELFLSIIQEQEPDFSAKICEGLTMADLNETAIQKMKESYARKQKNQSFLQLSLEQVLTDLKLLENGKLNFAALILLGKKSVIESHLPQSKIVWEFRNSETQIHSDAKELIDEPLFVAIDSIWKLINQPTLNKKYPVQSGAYIFDLYSFNEAVIREAVLNAIAHRDYTITSEVVIKQFPNKITIVNPGGFPKGVSIENILTVSSTPRSRLMTEILEKTGLVERSGQGVDKIFSITLSEGKGEPDYSASDKFQVSLALRTEVIDKAFHIFISQHQNAGHEYNLGVEQIITLHNIRNGAFQHLKPEIVLKLERLKLIEKVSGETQHYALSKAYHQLVDDVDKIGKRYVIKEVDAILMELQGKSLKVGDLEKSLADSLTRNQLKYLLQKLSEDFVLTTEGKLRGTRYSISKSYSHLNSGLLLEAVVRKLKSIHE